jgi:glycosyltransferase involved in cell wall biosynthesis
MKIVCLFPTYAHKQLAGSEMGAHVLNKFLVSQGHEVTVFCDVYGVQDFEGVKLMGHDTNKHTQEIRKCDWVFTMFEWSNRAATLATRFGKACAVFFHTVTMYSFLNNRYRFGNKLHVIYNSQDMANKMQYKYKSTILYPPVTNDVVRKSDKAAEYVTLINLNLNKGGDFLLQLADLMPDVKFLGVQGGYMEQIMDTTKPNIRYVQKTNNIKLVYELTKILIVPSGYESWGRVAHEAMMNGIPVISTDGSGIRELIGKDGIFCERCLPAQWANEIRKLLTDKEHYKQRQEIGYKRAAELSADVILNRFHEYLLANV